MLLERGWIDDSRTLLRKIGYTELNCDFVVLTMGRANVAQFNDHM